MKENWKAEALETLDSVLTVYHSRDMKNWELYTHVLTDDETVDLKKLPSSKGIWAPCLTWCESENLFYVVYGVMNSMNAGYFEVDNYLITASDIKGRISGFFLYQGPD